MVYKLQLSQDLCAQNIATSDLDENMGCVAVGAEVLI